MDCQVNYQSSGDPRPVAHGRRELTRYLILALGWDSLACDQLFHTFGDWHRRAAAASVLRRELVLPKVEAAGLLGHPLIRIPSRDSIFLFDLYDDELGRGPEVFHFTHLRIAVKRGVYCAKSDALDSCGMELPGLPALVDSWLDSLRCHLEVMLVVERLGFIWNPMHLLFVRLGKETVVSICLSRPYAPRLPSGHRLSYEPWSFPSPCPLQDCQPSRLYYEVEVEFHGNQPEVRLGASSGGYDRFSIYRLVCEPAGRPQTLVHSSSTSDGFFLLGQDVRQCPGSVAEVLSAQLSKIVPYSDAWPEGIRTQTTRQRRNSL